MRLARYLLLAVFLVVGCANLAFFIYWSHASEIVAIMPVSPTGYTIEALALNVTMLEIILVLVGFVLAALGLFGYTEIKRAAISAAIKAAQDEAKDTVSEQLKILDTLRAREETGSPEHSGDYDLGDQPIEGATPAKDE